MRKWKPLKPKQKKVAAEKEVEEQKAAEQKAAEEAAAAKAAEEAKGYETGITYDQLARTPDDFKGKKVKFYGKVNTGTGRYRRYFRSNKNSG